MLSLNEKGEITGGSLYHKKVIAKLFGLSSRRIEQLTYDGILFTTDTPDGVRYDLVPTIQNYVNYLSKKAYSKARSKAEPELREQKMKADIALKESQGELHRLKTDIAAGRYITIEEVTLDYERFFLSFKKFALSLPSRLSRTLSGYLEPLEIRRIEKELHADIIKLLTAFVVAGVTEVPGRK